VFDGLIDPAVLYGRTYRTAACQKKYGVASLVSKWYYTFMPRKIRELLRELSNAGFLNRGGKGSHRNLRHPTGVHITIRGHDGDDAKPYQEKAVLKALKETQP